MFKTLKNQFMQTTLVTFIWTLGIGTLNNLPFSFQYAWRLLGIAMIVGFIFGIVYPYIWSYGTAPAYLNIISTTLLNFIGGFSAVWLYSQAMLTLVLPYWWGMLLLNIVLHVVMFYGYRNYQNKQLSLELNQLTK